MVYELALPRCNIWMILSSTVVPGAWLACSAPVLGALGVLAAPEIPVRPLPGRVGKLAAGTPGPTWLPLAALLLWVAP